MIFKKTLLPNLRISKKGKYNLTFSVGVVLVVLLFALSSCTTDSYPSYQSVKPSVQFKTHEIIKTSSLESLPFLNEKENAIVDLERHNNYWYFFMVKDTTLASRQLFYYDVDFPKIRLDNYIDDGYLIKDLNHRHGLWTAILEKEDDSAKSQLLQIDPDDNLLADYRQKGFYTKDISHAPNLGWIYVLEKNQDRRLSAFFSEEKFPRAKILEYWNKNLRISKIKYVYGYWCVFMEVFPTKFKQSYSFFTHLPSNEIYESECQNSIVSQVEKKEGSEKWLVLFRTE